MGTMLAYGFLEAFASTTPITDEVLLLEYKRKLYNAHRSRHTRVSKLLCFFPVGMPLLRQGSLVWSPYTVLSYLSSRLASNRVHFNLVRDCSFSSRSHWNRYNGTIT